MSNRVKVAGAVAARIERRRAEQQAAAPEAAGAVNMYRCEVEPERAVFTINRDAGVTSFLIPCLVPEHGDSWHKMGSMMYRLPDSYRPAMVTMEWWLPTVEQARSWPGLEKSARRHLVSEVEQGAMFLAELTPETAQRFKVGALLG